MLPALGQLEGNLEHHILTVLKWPHACLSLRTQTHTRTRTRMHARTYAHLGNVAMRDIFEEQIPSPMSGYVIIPRVTTFPPLGPGSRAGKQGQWRCSGG